MLKSSADLIARVQAMPKKWRVTTHFADGATRHHDSATEGQANNYATGERRKIGRPLLNRDTNQPVRVVSVTINQIGIDPDFDAMSSADLNDWYEKTIGYRSQIDDPTMSDADLRQLCREYCETARTED